MEQLIDEKYKNLKFQFETSKFNNNVGVPKMAYAFTEKGVAISLINKVKKVVNNL